MLANLLIRAIMLVTMMALLLPGRVAALPDDLVVGNGSPGSCTPSDFHLAMISAGSGFSSTITFNCGGPAEILLSAEYLTSNHLTLDGAGQPVTLSGGNSNRLFVVHPADSLTLKDITLANGYADGDGGAIYNRGSLTLIRATIRDSATSASNTGGAIYSEGTLNITDSLLENNISAYGGALMQNGENADATITNSVLRGNHATINGGAIHLSAGADLHLSGSTLEDNEADFRGGGVYSSDATAVLLVSGGSMFRGNTAEYWGGGIFFADGLLSIQDTTFLDNYTYGSGINGSEGGGVYTSGSTAVLSNATFAGNRAEEGAGVYSFDTDAVFNNVTFVGNAADLHGGGYKSFFGNPTLTNVTFIDNTGSLSGALGVLSGTATVKNVIFAGHPRTTQCAQGDPSFPGTISSTGFNLSSDDSCNLNQPTDQEDAAGLRFGPLMMYGGLTPTVLPQAGNPAIDNGTSAGAFPLDQRGRPRPAGSLADIGAVELQPDDPSSWCYLPLTFR